MLKLLLANVIDITFFSSKESAQSPSEPMQAPNRSCSFGKLMRSGPMVNEYV